MPHLFGDHVIAADFPDDIPPHDESGFLGGFVLENPDVTHTALLPGSHVPVKPGWSN